MDSPEWSEEGRIQLRSATRLKEASKAGALTLDFAVDSMGNITRASDTLNPFVPDRAYKYDPLYRLITAQTGTTPSAWLEGYTYNQTGDRTSASLNGGPSEPYTYTANTHRLASVDGVARSHDANGNQTSLADTPYPLVYDDRNRLVEAKFISLGSTNSYRYTHNGSDERVANAGPLLQAPMQERLFDSLVSLRERSARDGATPHLGLGLYVVRLVAELHRGRASAANLADGSGVEFTITLAGMPRRRLSEGEGE